MALSERLLVVRASLAVRRAERSRRRQLERELGTYASPRELHELESILERYSEGETAELREILARQAAWRDAKRGLSFPRAT